MLFFEKKKFRIHRLMSDECTLKYFPGEFLSIWVDEDDWKELEGIYLRCANMCTDKPKLFNVSKYLIKS